jgi:uncharacterized membrane protein YsdA (DUF1294 family)
MKVATSIAIFVAHQLGGTFGVAVFAYLLGISLFQIAGLFGIVHSTRLLHHILTEIPYFPVQIVLGLWFGWVLGMRLRHQSMKYVWILPFLSLAYAVIAVSSLKPEVGYTSVLEPQHSALSHYFGWGCQPKDHCLDQLITTMPFYAALAYSLGAWVALRTVRHRALKDQRQTPLSAQAES